jgi:hypothetical protein
MNRPVLLLRCAYWIGAIFDALTLVPLLVPSVGAEIFGMVGFVPSPEYRYATALAAALMLGWTALLLWADRRPLERRGVLPLTVLAIAGLAAAGALAVSLGLIPWQRMLPTWLWQAALASFFLFAWSRARSAAVS